jgi:cyclin B
LVTRTKLQLVGCTALLLAAKYEEIYAPEVNDFVAISDKAYTREQIIAMEGIMLTALNFNLTVPLPINFLQRFARLCGVEHQDQVWTLSLYFMELTLQSYTFLHFAPSAIAASALYLAMGTAQQAMGLGHHAVWTTNQQSMMDYTPAQVASCVTEMYKLIELNQSGLAKYKAVKKKFTQGKFHEVAKYTCRPPTL